MNRLLALSLSAFLPSLAEASNIYLFSCGSTEMNNTISFFLTSHGHSVTIGREYGSFDGTVNLGGFDTVYLNCNYNWSSLGTMPVNGQEQLMNFVNAGGRLVTSEWVIFYTFPGSKFAVMEPIIPGQWTSSYGSVLHATYTQVTPHAAINAGLPNSFDFVIDDFTGTETYAAPKPGATVYYSTSNGVGAAGLLGWRVGEGSVFSFTSTCGADQVLDVNFGRLFSNVMGATAGTSSCYPNCDGSTAPPTVNSLDFGCFLSKFAAGDTYANCDGSTAPPSLNALDFGCFLSKFAAGCT